MKPVRRTSPKNVRALALALAVGVLLPGTSARGEGRVEKHTGAEKKETKPAPPKAEDTPPPPRPEHESWRVGVENADVAYRAPRTVPFVRLPSGREIPEGSQLRIRIPAGSKGRVRIVHKGGRLIEITTTALLRLLSSELTPGARPFRIALEDLPSNVGSEEGEEKEGATSLDRLVAFFVPRVPIANGVEPPRLSRKPWLQNPIRPTYPGPVHLVEAEELPAVVNFEWPIQGGQQEPHSFYLWMENRFVQAPQAIVRGGRLTVTLSDFGKYFWQVEDRTGQFVSAPRVIYLRRPGESLETGAPPTPTPEPSPNASPTPNDGAEGTFQLKSPRKRGLVTVCLTEGETPLLPLVVPNAVREAKRYVVETNPRMGEGRYVFNREDDRSSFETTVAVTRLGNVTFSVRAETAAGLVVQGDETPVRIVDVCGKGPAEDGAFQRYLDHAKGERIPESGALYLLQNRNAP